jgi:hypothetical protein
MFKIILLLMFVLTVPLGAAAETTHRCSNQPVTGTTYQKIHYFNTANWQDRTAIRLLVNGDMFNFEYCRQPGESFSLDTLDEFDETQYCELISETWLSMKLADEFHQALVMNMRRKIEDNFSAQERNVDFELLLYQAEKAIPLSLSVGYMVFAYKVPFRTLFAGKFVVRGLGWLGFAAALSDFYTGPKELESKDAQIRALDIKMVIHEMAEPTSLEQKSLQTDRIMNTLKRVYRDAMDYTWSESGCSS